MISADKGEGAKDAKRVTKNAFFLTSSDIFNKGLFFLFFIIASRHLGTKNFGILSFCISFVTMLNLITDWGMGYYLSREVARDKSLTEFFTSNIFTMKVILSLIAILMVFVLSISLNLSPDTKRSLYVMSPFILFNTLWLLEIAIFRAYEKMEYIAIGKICYAIILALGGIVLKLQHLRTEYFSLLYLFAISITFFLSCIILSKKFTKFTFNYNFSAWRSIIKNSIPFGLSAIFVTFYYWNNSTFILKWKGEEAVGWFNAPYRIVLGLATFGIAFSEALYPAISRYFVSLQIERIKTILSLGFKYITTFILPICLLVFIFSNELIFLLFGSSYFPSISALKILIWWCFFIYINSISSSFFNATNRAHCVARQTALSAAVNLIFNLILIKKFGLLGASCSLVVAELAGTIYLIILIYKVYPDLVIKLTGALLKKPIIALIVPGLFASIFRKTNVFLAIFLYITSYLFFIFINKGLSREDITLMKEIIKIK